MFICECWLFDWYFPQFCKFDMSKCGYLVSEGPFNFEIMRVDCISFFFSFLDSLCILCLKEIIWAMATFFAIFFGHGKIIWAMGIFSWAMARKVAMGEKMLPMGKMVKCFLMFIFN